MNILITGGTVFVSRFLAEYYIKKGHSVFLLNRGTRPQPDGSHLIKSDRRSIGDKLKGYDFDLVIAVSTYSAEDMRELLSSQSGAKMFVFISSSAVYPETLPQPFNETQPTGPNTVWGAYGQNKLEAERLLSDEMPHAYILRPPYLYGPMQNLYREGFVFDCAVQGLPFYIPGSGEMPLQFFYIEDLCRFIDILTEEKPTQRIFNVGSEERITVNDYAELCYAAAGKNIEKIYVHEGQHSQRSYFPFYDYAYTLDVSRQNALMPKTTPLAAGLKESFKWYMDNQDKVAKKPYLDYIRENFMK